MTRFIQNIYGSKPFLYVLVGGDLVVVALFALEELRLDPGVSAIQLSSSQSRQRTWKKQLNHEGRRGTELETRGKANVLRCEPCSPRG